MTFKFIKKAFLTIIVLCFFSLFLTINAKASTATIKYLTASVGETYDKVGISYHCSVDGSYVVYGTKVSGDEIVSATKVETSSTLWGLDQIGTDTASGMEDRYVCKANLTGLAPNTKYYYQAVSGTTVSNIQSFTTTSTDGSEKNFFFLTDIQSSGTGFKYAEKLLTSMATATKDKATNLVVMTGDQVDRGGYEVQWEDYYTYVPSLQNYLQATIPGNHEYYFSNSGEYVSNEIYNQFYNNPLNGPDDRLGSSYYFVWDQVLFIMLDTVKTNYNVKSQQEWFREVVKNNPSKWIIVGSHPGCYATGAYASDASYMRSKWVSVFEECQVDLCLNGHEHVYARRNLMYKDQKNEALGVTYLAGAAAGQKNYGNDAQASLLEQFDYYNRQLRTAGVSINILNDTLTCTLYDQNGQVCDTFSLTAKRPDSIVAMTDEEILDSFEVTYSKETSEATLSWDKNIYGNVSSFKVTGTKLTVPFNFLVQTNNISSQTWKGYYTDYNYDFKVEITKMNGSTLTKDLRLFLNPAKANYNISYELDGGTNHPDNPTSFYGENLPLDLSTFVHEPTKEGYNFMGWLLDDDKKVVTEIPENTFKDITLTAVWEKKDYVITYELNGGTNVSHNPTSFRDSSSFPIRLYPISKEGYEFVSWQLNGQNIDAIPEGTASNITLTAIFKEKEYTITYYALGGDLPQDAPTTYTINNKPTLPTPTKDGYEFKGWSLNGEIIDEISADSLKNIALNATWEKVEKKGCGGCSKSALAQLILGITLLSGAILIFRKRH